MYSLIALANSAVWVRSLVVPYSFSLRVMGSRQNECLRVVKFREVCKICSADWDPCPPWQMGVPPIFSEAVMPCSQLEDDGLLLSVQSVVLT
ncbi:hypothetical protein PoB_001170000 [Plakobranchus ocellatus]|uniref:Secreted protein n=1 Tax=Plakobranchus ocellatus TaxID=259542 RepID=A0AAV3YRX3_9GAST|nr:hypothetical protein PoB_001170000 [Plakobranchus ocellatus]